MTKTEARKLVKELERIAADNFGCPNEGTKRRVQAIARELGGCGLCGYFREKVGLYEDMAGIGLSHRKHERFPGGVRQATSDAIGACWTMENLIDRSDLPEK